MVHSFDQRRIHEGKIAIITGSSRGIGAAIARNLARKGANIVIVYQNSSSDVAAGALALELTSMFSTKAVICRADVSSERGVDDIVKESTRLCGQGQHFQIDIIVNNAARFSTSPVGQIQRNEFSQMYETNVLGPLQLVQKCLPHLPSDRSGRIVNISSVASRIAPQGSTLHAGTKAALESMTRTWARELAELCTVNAVSTGYTMTDMLRDAEDLSQTDMKLHLAMTPLSQLREDDSPAQKQLAEKHGGRAGYPEEVAGVVGVICEPESAWMTGCLLGANGGLTMIG